MRSVGILASACALSWCNPALAAHVFVHTGELTVGTGTGWIPAPGIHPSARGDILHTLSFSKPISGILELFFYYHWDEYCGPGYNYCGGNIIDYSKEFFYDDITEIEFITYGKKWVERYPLFMRRNEEYLTPVSLNYDMPKTPISYTWTITIPAIPEPATWMMLLMGFFTIGHTMRRQTRLRLSYS